MNHLLLKYSFLSEYTHVFDLSVIWNCFDLRLWLGDKLTISRPNLWIISSIGLASNSQKPWKWVNKLWVNSFVLNIFNVHFPIDVIAALALQLGRFRWLTGNEFITFLASLAVFLWWASACATNYLGGSILYISHFG